MLEGCTPEDCSPEDYSKDQFIGGQAYVLQLSRGSHRSGLGAVFLAASVPQQERGTLYDLGAGSGAAGFCVAARARHMQVQLVERDPCLVELAQQALEMAENSHFSARVALIEADITMPQQVREQAGLMPNSADWVIANPPYFSDAAVRVSPYSKRQQAHVLPEGGLETWFRAAAMLLKPGGHFVIIHKANELAQVLHLCQGRFGALEVRPVYPRAGKSANRVIVKGKKGSRGALTVLAGFVVHDEHGHTPEAKKILQNGQGFS